MAKIYPFDLHLHSNVSDGDFPVSHVVRSAVRLRMKGVVLTDHNTTASMGSSRKLAARFGLVSLDGIEISSRYLGIEVHFLGYSRKFKRVLLERSLKPTQRGYTERVEQQMNRAQRSGIKITLSDVERIRPHARFLVRYDLARALAKKSGLTVRSAIAGLSHGGDLYVPYGAWALTPAEVLKLVRRASGIVSLAHPGMLRSTFRKRFGTSVGNRRLVMLIKLLIQGGLKGLELRHPNHTNDDERFLRNLIRRFRLLPTGGSDYHGKFHHPGRPFGRSGLTEAEFSAWEQLLP